MVFGALISPQFLGEIQISGYVFAVLALVVARPVAIGLSFLGSKLAWQEQAAVAWFGPKGFASVVYGLIVLESGAENADEIFHIIALTVALSIVAHSSSDVPIAHYFARVRARQRAADDRATLNCDEPGAPRNAALPAGQRARERDSEVP